MGELWSAKVEQSMVEDSMLQTVYCDKQCGYSIRSFFNGKSAKCAKCGSGLKVNTLNGRNANVSGKTENFALELLKSVAKDISSELDQKVFAKRGVECPNLGLTGRSKADLALLSQDMEGPVPVVAIKCLLEVKMSFIWNWKEGDLAKPVADYDGHQGKPSIFRTDSILKAIGKAAITRSYRGSERIPFVVVGNSPLPPGYRENVDKTVNGGLIQKWISITPKPLVVSPQDSPTERNPKSSAGFLRIDQEDELRSLLKNLLNGKSQYLSAMVDPEKLGKLIKSLDSNNAAEDIGLEFLRRMNEANL